ncbi:MAG: helix-turn-helix domain-containing protein [Archangium sp.]
MDEKLQPRLGVVLRKARTRLGLTQEQVAKAVGFVPTVYGRIERGHMVPSTPKLRALCELLNISADVLLGLRSEEGAALEATPSPEPNDSPEIRRLAVVLRELPPDKLRLFRVVLKAFREPDLK